MFFIAKSVFWLAVVAALMPAGSFGSTPFLDSDAVAKFSAFNTEAADKIGEKAKLAALELCTQNPKLCAEGVLLAANTGLQVKAMSKSMMDTFDQTNTGAIQK